MDVIITGGLIRLVQGLLASAPTLIIGLFIASLFRYYLRTEGTKRLFGGETILSLPQSWAVGMLLPVCSIGVIPIIREMRRQGIRPGAITAFALAAPLFNPLSLLYGLTLSRPYVIVGFALGSLFIVTVLGLVWDRFAKLDNSDPPEDEKIIGLWRLVACLSYMGKELVGPTGRYTLLAVFGLMILGSSLPHGSLQSQVEQLDPMAPLKMAGVSLLVYATPILTMSQLGMMFDHGNSPGAAFTLLLLGTGINLATLWWVTVNFGFRSAIVWLTVLVVCVLGVAYTVERPLIPPGIEPAGHTHAFDIYTNPLHSGDTISYAKVTQALEQNVGLFEWIAGGLLLACFVVSAAVFALSFGEKLDRFVSTKQEEPIKEEEQTGLNIIVSPTVVGLTCLAGLVTFSIVGCYAFYPAPSECIEEMRLARTEVLSGVTSGDYERSLRWIPILEGWSRSLEVGYAIRNFELRPYQQMQTYLLRKKLESLEHAIEHVSEFAEAAKTDPDAADHLKEEEEEMRELRLEIADNANRLNACFK